MVDHLEVSIFSTPGSPREHSNVRLRRRRYSFQSSPNVYETVHDEYSVHLQQTSLVPSWHLRTSWENVHTCGCRRSPSFTSFTTFDSVWRSEASPSLFLTRTRSIPAALHCLNGPSVHSGFSSITITAQSRPPERVSTSHLSLTDKPHSASSAIGGKDKTLQAKSARRKAVVVTVTECTERHCTSETKALPGDNDKKGETVRQTDQTDSLSSSKKRVFRSYAHLNVPPSWLSKSTLYLEKPLSIPLGSEEEDNGTLHRSTLSLCLAKISQTAEKPGTKCQPKRSSSEWDMVNIGADGTKGPFPLVKNPPAGSGNTFRNNTSLDSNAHYSSLTSLPFRTRHHSSSATFRVNGKANDVLGPLQSNLKARQAFSKRSEHNLSKIVDSPVIIKTVSTEVNVKHHSQKENTTGSDLKDGEKNSFVKRSSIRIIPHVRVKAPHEVRTVSPTAENVRRVTKCLISPHLTNCTRASRPDQQEGKPQSLSLKEALELFRPDFISRSQNRVRRLEWKARQRRNLQTVEFVTGAETTIRRRNYTKPHPLSDNLFKPKDRVISGKEMQLRSRRIYNKLPEVTKKKEEEKKKLLSKSNRLKVEIFKKKLLDRILQRHSD